VWGKQQEVSQVTSALECELAMYRRKTVAARELAQAKARGPRARGVWYDRNKYPMSY
jgi:hypothetical protein